MSRGWVALTALAGVFLMAFGAFVVLAGEADDSPGLGGLGLITGLIGLVMILRTVLSLRRASHSRDSTPGAPGR